MRVMTLIRPTVLTLVGSMPQFRTARAFDRRFRPDATFIVNYHATYERDRANFARQLRFLAEHFDIVGLDDATRPRAASGKNRLVFTFDDGALSNFHVAAEELEKIGARGAFFIPSSFIDGPSEATSTTEKHRADGFHIRYLDIDEELRAGKGRVSMSWAEIRDLQDRGHHIGAHGTNHRRLSSELDDDALHEEVVEPRSHMAEKLGTTPNSFCWIGGELHSYSAEASRAIADAGYDIGLMTCCAPVRSKTRPLQWHRFNLEADWNLWRVRAVLGGLYEVVYTRKRRRVNRITATTRAHHPRSGKTALA